VGGKKLTAVLVVAVAVVSFAAGVALANRVVVGWVQPIAGFRSNVPNPGLAIVNATWSINANLSLVTDVDLLAFANGTPVGIQSFTIYVQVLCLNVDTSGQAIPGSEHVCATGNSTIPNPGPTPTPVVILLHPPINPETIEIDALSFIVTASRSPAPKDPTSTTVTCAPFALGSTTTCTANVTDLALNPSPPGQQVNFLFNNTAGLIGPCTLTPVTAAMSSCSVVAGPYIAAIVTAVYGGDSQHLGSTSKPFNSIYS
jgi:hypothetical protein